VQGPRRWSQPASPPPRRRLPPQALGGARLHPLALPVGGRLGFAPRHLLPLLGTHGDWTLRGGAVFIVHNDVGDGMPAPGVWDPSGASYLPWAFGPSRISIPPPAGGIASSSSASSSSQSALPPSPSISETEVSGEGGGATPAFSASQRFLAEISRLCAPAPTWPSCPPWLFSAPRSGPYSWPGSPCPLGLGVGNP